MAREALHLLRQRGSVDDYAKSFNHLIIKVPGMTLEEKLYIFIKGLKTNIQISVTMQDPTIFEQAKILAASADGILSQQRRIPPSGPLVCHGSPFIARPEPMEIGAVVQRRVRLDSTSSRRVRRVAYVMPAVRPGTVHSNTLQMGSLRPETSPDPSQQMQRAKKGLEGGRTTRKTAGRSKCPKKK
jgi:Retrotransposon gag protein